MREKVLLVLLLFLVYTISNSSSSDPKSECYISQCDVGSDEKKDLYYSSVRGNETMCKNVTECHLDDKCPDLSANTLGYSDRSEHVTEQIEMTVFSTDYDTKVLNLTVTNIHFTKLKILFQYTENKKIYQAIDLSHLAARNLPKQFSWLFPVIKEDLNQDATLETLVEVDSTNYFKQYKVKIPYYQPDDMCQWISDRHLFTYVDTTKSKEVRLHIQPFPANCNVTKYEVEFCKYLNSDCQHVERDSSNKTGIWKWHPIPKENTYYHFTVLPSSSKYDSNRNPAYSAMFMKNTPPAVIIFMIVGAVCISIVMSFVLRQCYAYWTKHHQLPLLRARKPHCLLTYDATHDMHIDVMTKLAEYLRSCDINAMIDVLDAPKDPLRNPSLWCTSAFKMANTVIVAESPPRDISVTVTRSIYRHLYDHAQRLIEEDYHQKKRRYFVIEFPYYKSNSVQLETYFYKRFKMPKDLDNLVDEIHNATYSKLCPRDKGDFIETLNLAKHNILNTTLDKKPISSENISRYPLEYDNDRNNTHPVTSDVDECTIFMGCQNDDKKRKYATDISELELLGDSPRSA